jgi:hypothetical protein
MDSHFHGNDKNDGDETAGNDKLKDRLRLTEFFIKRGFPFSWE